MTPEPIQDKKPTREREMSGSGEISEEEARRNLDEVQKRFVDVVMGGMPQCDGCKHETEPGYCKAFPDGIPDEITAGEHDHRKAFKGDKGIRFEPKDDEEE